MNFHPLILAADDGIPGGIPPGVIVFGVVALLWALGAIFGKSTPREGEGDDALADIRRRMREEAQRARGRVPPGRPPIGPPMSQPTGRPMGQAPARPPSLPKSKPQKRQQRRRQAAVAQVAHVAQAVVQRSASRVAPPASTPLPEVLSAGTERRAQVAESARNVRLMLQRGAVREAFVLGEVLGKPKSMRDD